MYQSFNSSPEASARSTYAAFATIMQKLQRSDNMSRCDPVLSPLRGPAHKLSAMSRSTLQDIQGYVSYRYGAQQKMTNEVKKPTGDKFVFHLRPDEMEEAKVDITDEVGTDLASPINDYQEYAPALMDTQHPVSVYSDNLEGDVDLEVNAEDDQARLILSLEVEADLITYICTVQDPDEEKVRSLRHIASPHQHDLVLQHADVAEVDIWDQDFELSDDDSVQEAICTPLTSPRSAPSTYISPSSSSVTIPPPTAIGEDFKLVEIPSGRRSRAGFHRVVQVDPPSSEANLDEADPELVVSTSSSQHAAFLPYADIEVDEIWRSLQHEKSRKYSIEHNGGYTHGDIDEVAGEDTTTDEFCDDDAKTPVSPSKLILANEEDTSTSPHTPSSVSPVSLNVDDTSAEATRKVRLARSHGGVSLAALIAAAGLDEGDPDSSSTSDTSSDSEDNGLDTSFGYIYSNTPVRASENGYSNQPPCLDPTFPGHSPCAGRKSLGFGRSRDAALQAVRRRVESQDYATGQSDWYREWMTAKYEASNSIVMFNGGSSLRYEVSAEEVHGCEVILEEEVKMSLKEELDAIAEDYAIDTILEEEEDVSSVFEEIGGGDLEALHFLEDAAVAAEFVVGGDEIEEDLVEDESSLFDWTVGVYVDPTPLPEEDEDTALDYLLSSLPVQMDDHDLEEAMSEGFGSEAMEFAEDVFQVEKLRASLQKTIKAPTPRIILVRSASFNDISSAGSSLRTSIFSKITTISTKPSEDSLKIDIPEYSRLLVALDLELNGQQESHSREKRIVSLPEGLFSPPQITNNVGNILGWAKDIRKTPYPVEDEKPIALPRLASLDLESLYCESIESTDTVIITRPAALSVDDAIETEDDGIALVQDIDDYTLFFDAAVKRPHHERFIGGLKKQAKKVSGKARGLVAKTKKFGRTLRALMPVAKRTGNPMEVTFMM